MFDILLQSPVLLYGVCGFLGLLFGSFYNVVIYRLPKMLFLEYEYSCKEFLKQTLDNNDTSTFNLVKPASTCPECKTPLRIFDNIPILSFIALKGKCAHCQHPISIRYPLVEMLTAIIAVACVFQFGATYYGLMCFIYLSILLIVTCIDIDHKIIPDNLVIPFTWLSLLFYAFIPSAVSLQDALLGAVLGYLSLWSVYIVFKLITHKEGMGHGDFKLLAMIGCFLGWKMILLVIILSSLLGAGVGMYLLVKGNLSKETDKAMPFGPFLSVAGCIGLFWGEPLIQWYFRVSGLN